MKQANEWFLVGLNLVKEGRMQRRYICVLGQTSSCENFISEEKKEVPETSNPKCVKSLSAAVGGE